MPFFSVHLRGNGLQPPHAAEFVRQAFSWTAFFLGPFWLAWYRLWIPLVLWAGACAGVFIAAAVLSQSAIFALALAIETLLGLEAAALLEAKLAGRGYLLADIVAAPDPEEAEVAFFRRLAAAGQPCAEQDRAS